MWRQTSAALETCPRGRRCRLADSRFVDQLGEHCVDAAVCERRAAAGCAVAFAQDALDFLEGRGVGVVRGLGERGAGELGQRAQRVAVEQRRVETVTRRAEARL